MKRYALRYFIVWTALLQNFKSTGQEPVLFSFSDTASAQRIRAEYLHFYSEDRTEKVRYVLDIANGYKAEERFSMALAEIDSALKDTASVALLPRALFYEIYFQQSLCLFLIDSCERANQNIRNLLRLFPDSLRSKRTALLSVLVLNHLQNYSESKEVLTRHLLSDHRDTSGVYSNYSQAMTTRYKRIGKARNLARYLPGAGFFYLKKPTLGVTSLALNAAFLGYTAYSIYTGYYVTAVFTGLGNWMRFHGGGVRASTTLAAKHNTQTKNSMLRTLDSFCLAKIYW